MTFHAGRLGIACLAALLLLPAAAAAYDSVEDELQWLEQVDEDKDNKDFTDKYVALCSGRSKTTNRIVQCFGEAHAEWDRILNRNYRIAMRMCGFEANPQKCRDDLRNAQRAWIRQRDADADAEAREFEGGTFARVARNISLYASTRKRAEELERRCLK